METATLTPGTARWRDHLREEAGRWARRAGARKNAAKAHDVTPQRMSQVYLGDRTGAPQRFYVWLDEAARSGRIDPYAELTGAHLLVEEAMAETLELDLEEDFAEVAGRETASQGEADVRMYRFVRSRCLRDLEAFIESGEAHLVTMLHLLGVARVLRRIGWREDR